MTQNKKLTPGGGVTTQNRASKGIISRSLSVLSLLSLFLISVISGCSNPGGGSGSSTPTPSQNLNPFTLGQKIEKADFGGVANDYFGCSVAVYGDTAIIGVYGDDDNSCGSSGSAFIYEKSGGSWIQKQKLNAGADAGANDQFGTKVAIYGDTAVVGVPFDDAASSGDTGTVYIFTKNNGTWTQTQKLTLTEQSSSDYFGSSVAISGDVLIVGAYGDDEPSKPDSGAAYIFTRNGGTWSQTIRLTAGADAMNSDQFGCSVGISGNTAIVGARYDDDDGANSGTAFIFTNNGGTWSLTKKLTAGATLGAAGDSFGFSVAVSDGTIIVGAKDDDDGGTDTGSVYFYTESGGVWSLDKKMNAGTFAGAGDQFGWAVTVSGDTAIIGAQYDDDDGMNSGSAYLIMKIDGVWTLRQRILAGANGGGFDNFGQSVAVSGDSTLIGAPCDDSNAGSAYFFGR